MKKSRKIATRLPLFVSTMLLGGAILASANANDYGALTGNKAVKRANGTWYTDFATWDEAKEYGEDVNVQIMEEGSVLLKNTNEALPLKKGSSVSLLGNCSYNVVTGGTGSGAGAGIKVDMPKALKNAGFSVNGLAEDFYSTLDSTAAISGGMFSSGAQYVQEDPAVLAPIEDSYRNYKTVVWSISRTGGEGSDLLTHGLPNNADPTKHYLELNDNELKMVEYLGNLKKAGKIDKVIMLVNTANVMEMEVVENSDAIDAILWIGQPGPNGLDGVGHILNGTACPSGRTVDIWDADHKKDPTWQNFGDNGQHTYDETTQKYDSDSEYATNSVVDGDGLLVNPTHVVEYEEGIYVGYKYYETADAEAKAGNYSGFNYDQAVVYPFGYGLSYTTFDQELVTTSSEVEAAYKASSKLDDTIKIKVKVTNRGHVAGKEVVQLYNHAPYTKGGIEKAEVALIGFEKTSLLQPGQSEVVEVEVRLADLASFDYNDANKNSYKGYEIEAGAYELRLQKNSHEVIESLKVNFEAKNLDNDDDATNNTPYSMGDDYDSLINMKAEGSNATMTLMSRSNFTNTFPTAPKQSEKDYGEYVTEVLKNTTYTQSAQVGHQTDAHRYTGDINGSDDKTTDPWYKTNADIPSTWTQATTRAAGEKTAVQLKELAGYDYWDTTTIVKEGTYKDKTAAEAWELFMNQLTYTEMTSLFSGSYSTPGLDAAGKDYAVDQDGPAQLASGVNFACEVNLASTWNLDLAYERGRVVGNDSLFQNVPGWYGPAMNIHRSAFSGRNFEYYSQDALLSGKMAAKDVEGYQDKGGYVYIKHYAMNDCETDRIGIGTFASEQAMREDYLKAFELAVKDGGAKGVMTSFNRIGMVPASGNYVSSQMVLRDEWGFHGQTVTDYYMGTMARGNMALRAGNEMPLGRANWGATLYGTWDATLRDGKGGVRSGNETDGVIPESPTQYYAVRTAALHIMWVGSSTNVIENGYDKTQFEDQDISFLEGIQDSKSIALDTDKYGTTNNKFTITSGSLPAGLTFDENTGTFSGTPTKAGTYELTVTLTSDKWVTSTAKITLEVSSLVTIGSVSTGDSSVRYEVGLNSDIEIVGDITDQSPVGTTGFTEVTYERIGDLPAGLTETFDEDGNPVITGTTTEESYKIKYKATLTKKTVNGWGDFYKWVTTSYVSATTELVVGTPKEETKSIASCAVNAAGELVVTYTDGTSENLGVVKGADGADGKTGIGVDGNDGTRIESVEKTGTEGLVDTYTITMTDGSTFTFTVTNGANGADGAKGADGAAGAKGDKGDTGAAGAAGEAGKGCGGSVIAASTTIGAVALLAAGLVFKKRREEK